MFWPIFAFIEDMNSTINKKILRWILIEGILESIRHVSFIQSILKGCLYHLEKFLSIVIYQIWSDKKEK